MLHVPLAFLASITFAQTQGDILIPSTSIERPADLGRAAHTNHLILNRAWRLPTEGPEIEYTMMARQAGPSGYTPNHIRAAYGFPATGGSGAIAIVIAYHYPNARRDFNVFAAQFNLPQETSTNQTLSSNKALQVVYQGTTAPTQNTGWNQEAAMDIQWAHAMAPSAKIYLVEANSPSINDLTVAVKKAATLPGVRCVSMSWGATEFSAVSQFESTFTKSGVVFFASSGDIGGQKSWPALSPNVICVGGTSLKLSSGVWNDTVWSGSGGGISSFFNRPSYQNSVSSIVGPKRGGPDISAVADPATGAAVYAPTSATNSAWMVFGGTSLSAPIVAGAYNLSGRTTQSSALELSIIYSRIGTAGVRDVVSGKAGNNSARAGYDLASGVGCPKGIGAF
ncbi:MAG: S53 family peptidase [Armatimonadetes bacterium]|nr:S53 family peptidase [Armatimonadota bacterium]